MSEKMVSFYNAKNKKIITEIINIKNFDTLLLLENHAYKIKELLNKQGINTIAVYGMGYVGQKFVSLMEKANVKVCYGIDKNSTEIVGGIKVLKPEEVSIDMDIIVITPEQYYQEIVELLETKVKVPIVRLSELLEELQLYG